MSPLLFVYGTLMRSSQLEQAIYLRNHADYLSTGWIPGRLYDAGGYPGLQELETYTDWVYGEIYQMHEPERLLSRLDAYEEATDAFPSPQEYKRKEAELLNDKGKICLCHVYYYQWPVTYLALISKGIWRL